jgi:hypothetical protein
MKAWPRLGLVGLRSRRAPRDSKPVIYHDPYQWQRHHQYPQQWYQGYRSRHHQHHSGLHGHHICQGANRSTGIVAGSWRSKSARSSTSRPDSRAISSTFSS